jgi:hypothetical protein
MKRIVLLVVLLVATASPAFAALSKLGVGLHYLHNLGDLKNEDLSDLEKDSFGVIGSYQFSPGVFKIEGDVEYIFNYLGTDDAMWEPSAWGLTSGMVYGGAGIGIGYRDGDWQKNPWYALRAGLDMPLAKFDLDAYATYRFQSAGDLGDVVDDLDSLTFAAVLRFPFGP